MTIETLKQMIGSHKIIKTEQLTNGKYTRVYLDSISKIKEQLSACITVTFTN